MNDSQISPTNIARDASGLPSGPTRMHAPDSVTRRIGGDVRNMLMAGSIFTLQVAHPIVGTGVHQHSKYREDPWGRLKDIDASGRRFLWKDEASARIEGARLRAVHRDIKGFDASGERYHSLDPHGYGWVHTVFLDAMLRQTELYGDPLTPEEEQRLFLEWYEAALFLGLRDRDLPQTLDAYRARFEHALAHELEHNAVVAHLLGDRVFPPPPPPLAFIPRPVWSKLVEPLGITSQWLALAGLPATYREGIRAFHPWGRDDEKRLERLSEIVHALVPRLPRAVRMLSVPKAA
jgi:uncharacterized protein (DUF2236 family)